MATKIIDPAPVIKRLANRCLAVKGMECTILGEVIDMLVAEPDVEVVQQWISINDRLPVKDGRYLVLKNIYGTPWYDVIYFAKNGRKVDKYDFRREWKNVWYRYDSEWGNVTTNDVTHWMPLPEPPKGE